MDGKRVVAIYICIIYKCIKYTNIYINIMCIGIVYQSTSQ